MSDYISREAAIEAFEKELSAKYNRIELSIGFVGAKSILSDLPAADVVERKKGKWKRAYLDHEAMGKRPSIFYCSACNQCIAYPVNYCPSCGADMRGEGHE